jgi:hypothetical protein
MGDDVVDVGQYIFFFGTAVVENEFATDNIKSKRCVLEANDQKRTSQVGLENVQLHFFPVFVAFFCAAEGASRRNARSIEILTYAASLLLVN